MTRHFLAAFLIAFLTCGAVTAQGNADDARVWVTMGQDAFDMLSRSSGVISDTFPLKSLAAESDVVVTRLQSRDLNAVSTFMHVKANRCSGFIVHDTFEEATAAMEASWRNLFKTLPSDFTIDQQTTVNAWLPQLDKANILSTISHLSTNYTNRYYQYASGQQSAQWIHDLWAGYAAGRSDVTVTTYTHGSYVQPSVIMTINGNSLASEVIVLGGHLDSIKSGGMTTGTIAPGADDNASGIATLSEVIRVLMANGWAPDRTVKFMGYAAEEVGLLGSGDIAQDHLNASTDVVAVMQLDMTNFNGSIEDISLIDDNTNADLRAFVGTLIDTYQPSLTWSESTCGYGCSDHASWHNRGYPAVMPFEARMNQHNQAIHSSNDTLATLGNQTDHALKFSKLALSFAVETGMAGCLPVAVGDAGADRAINDGSSTTIGTPAQAGNTYSWSPGGATSAEVLVTPTSTTTYTVTATSSCGTAQDSVVVTVIPAGQNGPQDAVYDAGLGAPKCAIPGSDCDSLALLDGRASAGPEPNQPNTIDNCTDGGSGNYHSDESNDKIVVTNLAGTNFSEGDTVQVDATVYAYSTGSSDTLDLYYAADASNPTWVHIVSTVPSGGAVQTISAQYTLPAGSLQAVRANFRYQGSQSSCSGGNYDDADDLVFAVEAVAACAVNADCDDGAYCNGAEVCNAGTCQAGSVISCGDGVSCTDDVCNEATDACESAANDANCDNGLFCDGVETCDPVNDCQAGVTVSCTDGVSCTDDSCNEAADSCDNIASDVNCDNGLFCDGAETCDAINDCQAATPPCSGGQTCDEGGDVCTGGNPVTVTFTSIAGEDGWVLESSETSNVGGSSNSTGSGKRPIRPGDGTSDRQYKSILSFDTSSLPPGAAIQSATVRLLRGTVRGSDPFTSGFGSCRVDVMSGGFSGSTALQNSDFEAAATASAAASLSAPASNGSWSEGVLNAAGLAAINGSGTTQLRVYFDVDDNDDGGDDLMGYYSGDNSNSANHPQLVVTYLP